jgi:outer membrane protein TolC
VSRAVRAECAPMPRFPIARLYGAVILVLAQAAADGRALRAQESEPMRLTLADAIARAREHGTAAVQARATHEAAAWRARAFHGRLLPQVSLSATAPNVNRSIIPVLRDDGTTVFVPQRQTESSLLLNITQRLPITGGDFTVSSGLTRLDRFGETDSRIWRSTPVEVSLRQNLFRTNTLAWDSREQELRARVAERQYLEANEDVAVSTVGAFFEAYIAVFAVRNATRNIALNDSLFNTAKGRYEVGKIGENELLQSELALLRAQITLDGALLQRERNLAALRIALELPPDTPLELVPPTEIPTVNADSTRAEAEALQNRSQVLDLELQDVQARRRVVDARRATGLGATVTATAGFNQSAPLMEDAYRSLLQQQRFGLSVEMPLYLGGARSAEIQAAEADERRVAAGIENTFETMRHEVKFAVLEVAQARRLVASSAKADTVARLREESAKNRYLIGRIPINEFYQAQAESDNVTQQYLQALRGYWQAYYRLRRLTLFDFATGERLVREE